MHINWDALKEKKSPFLILDILMLFIAIINLLSFSFDYTYLSFRNVYFHYAPALVKYDQIKGIMPHRTTEDYLVKAQEYFDNFPNTEKRLVLQTQITDFSMKLIDEDPFKVANKSGELEVIKDRMRKFMHIDSSKKAFRAFWEITNENFEVRQKFFNTRIKRIIETNYWRGIDTTGNYTDYYWYIDSVFVTVFLFEFLFMWKLSVRKRGTDEKVLYPLYHWYDVVSCIPLQAFRALRLLRVISIYLRLVKAGILIEDNGAIKRVIKKYNEIINEEISAQVSVKILSDIQEKIKIGANRTIIQDTIVSHKEEIQKELVKNIKQIQFNLLHENHKVLVDFISHVAHETIQDLPEYKKVKNIPYVGDKVSHLVSMESLNKTIDQSMQSFSKSLNNNLNKPQGDFVLNKLVEDILEETLIILQDEVIQKLIESINIKIVEELKKGTEIKKWKLK